MVATKHPQIAMGGPTLEALQQSFKQAMRGFAGAVSVVTVADPLDASERSGFTATSVSSFSATPPMVVASMKATSSSAELLQRTRRFGINLLREEQQAIAQRFTGFGGEAGVERYGSDAWTQLLADGAPVLVDAVVAMDCEVDELVERHGHFLIIGRVREIRVAQEAPAPLLYWQGRYTRLAQAHAN